MGSEYKPKDYNKEVDRLAEELRARRTRNEQLNVIGTRLLRVDNSIQAANHALQMLSDEYDKLKTEIEYYRDQWGVDPTKPPRKKT